MKTITSIIEVVMYNLFPAALVAPVIIFFKDIIPLLGIALIRIGLHIIIYVQKFQNAVLQKLQHVNRAGVDDDAEIAYNNIKRSQAWFKENFYS